MTMPVKDAPFLEERTAAVMESVFNDPIVKKALEQAVPQVAPRIVRMAT